MLSQRRPKLLGRLWPIHHSVGVLVSEDLVGCPRIHHGEPGTVEGNLVELVGEAPLG